MRTAFVLTVLSLSLVVGVPSAQARLSTEAALYESAAPNLGGPEAPRAHVIITEYRPRHWDIQGCDYIAGWINTSPQRHKVIYAHGMDDYIVGVGRLQPNGQWAIWTRLPFSDKPDVRVATVVRRSATRWDILRQGKKIGWARGPDGPEATTALLSICLWAR